MPSSTDCEGSPAHVPRSFVLAGGLLAVCAARNDRSSMRSHEIDESVVDIDADQLHANLVADVGAARAVHDLPLHRRMKNADPRSLRSRARDDAFEVFVDTTGENARGCRFANLSLHFVRRVFLLRAVI